MTNFLTSAARAALISRYHLWKGATRRLMLRSPRDFRELLWLDGSPPRRWRQVVQPWQERDLAALDAAWLRLAEGVSPTTTGRPVFRRAYIERPRGHSKTTDISVQILWILLAAPRRLAGLAAAADREQARLITRAMRRLCDANPELTQDLQFLENLVRHHHTGAALEIISSDVNSSYGALPDFVVCDELCHWENEGLWHSLLSAAAKKPDCLLTVLTNAGVGRGWQWRVREHARSSRDWYFSSLAGPQAPWITDDALAEQRAMLPPAVFERLWLNVWQHSDGEFVTLAEAEACRDETLTYCARGRPDRLYAAAVDYAEKHDYTVGCVCHREGERIIVDRMDVVRPTPLRPTPVQWVHDWIQEIAANFPHVRFVLDPHQLVQTIQQWERRYDITRFDFLGGAGNHRLAMVLHQLIVQRQIAWYPGCGTVETPTLPTPPASAAGRDDLETELASLLLRQSASGRLRFDHRRDRRHHDDRAFALAVAALTLCEEESTPDWLEVTPPTGDGGFAWA